MGYSCTVAAAHTQDRIIALFRSKGVKESNGLPSGGFFERGRENPDGSITGSVWRPVRHYTDAERQEAADRMGMGDHPEWVCDPHKRSGSYKIAANGMIVRFPDLTSGEKLACSHQDNLWRLDMPSKM